MRNRIHNADNPYQGNARKVLCVCSAGLLRSPTAAEVLREEFGHNTRAVGVDAGHALIVIDEVLVHWADEIVVMDAAQARGIIDRFSPKAPIVVLGIDDDYSFRDVVLQNQILSSYKDKSKFANKLV